mgnify:CR=1 FL=1
MEGVSLPLLQDDNTQDVWTRWGVTYRDVVVLDGENQVAGSLNLSNNSLAEESNWLALKTLLLDAAGVDSPSDPEDTAAGTDSGL